MGSQRAVASDSNNSVKNVVVLGGSFAGVNIAHSLLNKGQNIKVTMVNPRDEFYFCITGPRIVAEPNAFKQEKYLFPLKKAFEKYGSNFEFVESASKYIDPTKMTVSLASGQDIPFDYLVIATGSTTSCPTFKPSEDTAGSIHNLQEKIAAANRILIGGGGPLGVEIAGEIAYAYPKKKVMLASHGPRLLDQLKQKASDIAKNDLEKLNVDVITGVKVTGCKDGVGYLDSGKTIDTDLYIPSIGVKANSDFVPKSYLDEDGFVKVDKHMKVADRIYAAGDVAQHKQKLFIRAVQQASVVSSNVMSELSGKSPSKTYSEGGWITLVPIGPETGTGQMSCLTPFGFMVRKIKGGDYFMKWARFVVYQ